jgi:hypothetical protein
MTDADTNFYFDPVCPFALTSGKEARLVMAPAGLHRGPVVLLVPDGQLGR